MTGLFNDRYYLNLILAVLFILGIGASLYFIYSLPAGLSLTDGYQPQFVTVYLVLGTTFLLGGFAITAALRYKKEIIVYRDRTLEAAGAAAENDQAGKTTISLESVKSSLQQAKSEKDILQAGIQAVCKQLDAGQGALYVTTEAEGKRKVELKIGYALTIGESTVISYEFGEGLVGQSAAGARTLYIDDIPEGYIRIISGLGSASPKYLLIAPLKSGDQVKGVLEIASFHVITEDQRKFVEESAQLMAEKVSTKS